MDLYREKRIAMDNRMVHIVNASPTNYPFFDRILELLDRKKMIRINSLMTRMGYRNLRYKRLFTDYLVDTNHIIRVKKRFLFIPYNRYYASDREKRTDIIRHIRDILLRHETPKAEDMYLLSLIRITRLFRAFSDRRDERKAMRQHLKLILSNGQNYFADYEHLDAIKNAIKRAIMAANAAKSAH